MLGFESEANVHTCRMGLFMLLPADVLPFPFQAKAPELRKEQDLALQGSNLPALRLIVELNGGGSFNLQRTEQMKVNQLGVKADSGASRIECQDGCAHC